MLRLKTQVLPSGIACNAPLPIRDVTSRRLPISPLFLVVFTMIIEVTGSGLLFPVLPYLVEQYRSDAVTIGLLSASFATAQFFAAPVLGTLSDRVGRRPIFVICTAGTAVSFFLFGFADRLWILFAAQIANGLTGGVVSTAQAYIADISTSRQERTKNFGLIGAAVGIGFILGPLVGGGLGGIDLRLPVFIAGGLATANAISTYFILPESLKTPNTKPLTVHDFNPIVQLDDLLSRPRLRNLLLGYFSFFIAFSGFTNIFVVLVRDRFAWQPLDAAGILFFVGIISSIVQGGLIRKLLPRFGELALTLTGFSLVAVSLCIVPFLPRGYLLYGTQAIFAFGVGIAAPSLRGLIANSVSDEEQGKVSGGSFSLNSLTQILGPLLAGLSYDYIAPDAPMWFGVILATLGVVAIASVKRQPPPPRFQPQASHSEEMLSAAAKPVASERH